MLWDTGSRETQKYHIGEDCQERMLFHLILGYDIEEEEERNSIQSLAVYRADPKRGNSKKIRSCLGHGSSRR